jgi:hypothetical protein
MDLVNEIPARARATRSIAVKHALLVAVAVVYLAISLANGGYSQELIAAGALVIWWAVVIGLAVRGWPRSPVPRPAIAAGVLLAALSAWTAASIDWASDDGGAFVEAVRVLSYLGLFALVVVASPRGSARAWLTGLALGLAGVAAIGTAPTTAKAQTVDEDDDDAEPGAPEADDDSSDP